MNLRRAMFPLSFGEREAFQYVVNAFGAARAVFTERVSAPLCGQAALRRFSFFLRCDVNRLIFSRMTW